MVMTAPAVALILLSQHTRRVVNLCLTTIQYDVHLFQTDAVSNASVSIYFHNAFIVNNYNYFMLFYYFHLLYRSTL